jgi:hypothetical protein
VYAERLIGTIRRECIDHMIVFGEAHLRRMLSEFAIYYSESRIHRSLDKDAPFHRMIERRPGDMNLKGHGLLTTSPLRTIKSGFALNQQVLDVIPRLAVKAPTEVKIRDVCDAVGTGRCTDDNRTPWQSRCLVCHKPSPGFR